MSTKLYALAIAAMRDADTSVELSMRVAMMTQYDGADLFELIKEAALDSYPTDDGWRDHHTVPMEITQGFELDPYRLIWSLEDAS